MTERINVKTKTTLNHLHATLALMFWTGLGIAISYWLSENTFFKDNEWIAVMVAFAIGAIRVFIINDKYAWQVATIEEIRDIKKILEKNIQPSNEKTEQPIALSPTEQPIEQPAEKETETV